MGLLLEALEKANTNASNIYVIQKQVLSDTELLIAKRNRIFSSHTNLIESTDKRANLSKYIKFNQRSFDDPARGTVVPIKTSSQVPPQQIQQSIKQFGLKLRNHFRNFGHLCKQRHRNYAPKRINIDLAGVNHG